MANQASQSRSRSRSQPGNACEIASKRHKNVSFNLRLVDVNTTNLKGEQRGEGGAACGLWVGGATSSTVWRGKVCHLQALCCACAGRALLKLNSGKPSSPTAEGIRRLGLGLGQNAVRRCSAWSCGVCPELAINITTYYSTNKPSTTTTRTNTSGNNNNKNNIKLCK